MAEFKISLRLERGRPSIEEVESRSNDVRSSSLPSSLMVLVADDDDDDDDDIVIIVGCYYIHSLFLRFKS